MPRTCVNCNRVWHFESSFCYLDVDTKDWAQPRQGELEAACLAVKGREPGNCFDPKDTREYEKYCVLCAE
eukprot:7821490-Lingulodinium_polyedra.AAC.1